MLIKKTKACKALNKSFRICLALKSHALLSYWTAKNTISINPKTSLPSPHLFYTISLWNTIQKTASTVCSLVAFFTVLLQGFVVYPYSSASKTFLPRMNFLSSSFRAQKNEQVIVQQQKHVEAEIVVYCHITHQINCLKKNQIINKVVVIFFTKCFQCNPGVEMLVVLLNCYLLHVIPFHMKYSGWLADEAFELK